MHIEPARTSIRAVFFDYDGVLTTDSTGSLTTCRYLSQRTGIAMTTIADALRRYNDDLTIGRRSYADVWPEFCELVGQAVPLGLLPLAFESTPTNQPMFDLANELKRGWVVGIITDNKNDRIDHLRRSRQLDNLFEPIVVSAEIGCTKQNPAIFEEALARAGVEAVQSIFIDNSSGNLIAARALGMHTIHFDDAKNDVQALRNTLREEYALCIDGAA